MKGLILAGGTGSRLRPITHTRSKQLIPVANRPILYYALDAMADAGITEVAVVVGDTEEEIRGAVGDGSPWDLRVSYVRQPAPLGLAHAVLTAEPVLGDEPFLMYLGDNLVAEGVAAFVRAFQASRPNAQIFLAKVPQPERFGVAVCQGDRVTRLVEKPREHLSDLALAGVYLFDASIFTAARSIEPSARGELEITDAIQYLIDHGYRVRAERITGWWKDTGRPEDLLEANRILLDQSARLVRGSVDPTTTLHGEVVVEAGAEVVGSVLRGPCAIGPGARVVRSEVGPYVAVSGGTRIEESTVRGSILMEGSLVSSVRWLEDSIVGTGSRIVGHGGREGAHRLTVGDASSIELP